ncbi:MAG: hypothetical protein QXG35_07250 [Nitrososphaerota archaeon]
MSESGKKKTTIQVSMETLELLRRYCPKNVSYDKFIRELLRKAGYTASE